MFVFVFMTSSSSDSVSDWMLDEEDDAVVESSIVAITSGELFLRRMYVTERMTVAIKLVLALSKTGTDPLAWGASRYSAQSHSAAAGSSQRRARELGSKRW